MHYTGVVKQYSSITFASVLCLSVIAAFIVSNEQQKKQTKRLLSSSSIKDQLDGIEQVKNEPLDFLIDLLSPFLESKNEASDLAQETLIAGAFKQERLKDLNNLNVNRELLEAAHWWKTKPKIQTIPKILVDQNVSAHITHLAWFLGIEDAPTFSMMTKLTKNGTGRSVLISVLTIEKFGTSVQIQDLIKTWSTDYDLDRRKAAILLGVLIGSTTEPIQSQIEELSTLQTVCLEMKIELVWRTMHNEDGTINPEIALVGMLANKDVFFPVLLDSVSDGLWAHPEDPIALAFHFAPEIANRIPFELLKGEKTRLKWWTLFSCGLLLEER
jgi:hypothetical protein